MRSAFTLFELIVVLAIIVVVAALAVPTLEGLYSEHRVQAAADALRSGLAEARTHAMEEGQPYRFSVVFGMGNYRVAPDISDYWTGNDPQPPDPANPPLILSSALPKGVRFRQQGDPAGEAASDTILPADSVAANQWTTVAVFLPDGSARDDAAITLDMSGARPMVVRLRGLTGGVSVRPVDKGGRQ
jgi:prepilin-type N-terminal cleavage/methylation domain-containing protein